MNRRPSQRPRNRIDSISTHNAANELIPRSIIRRGRDNEAHPLGPAPPPTRKIIAGAIFIKDQLSLGVAADPYLPPRSRRDVPGASFSASGDRAGLWLARLGGGVVSLWLLIFVGNALDVGSIVSLFARRKGGNPPGGGERRLDGFICGRPR